MPAKRTRVKGRVKPEYVTASRSLPSRQTDQTDQTDRKTQAPIRGLGLPIPNEGAVTTLSVYLKRPGRRRGKREAWPLKFGSSILGAEIGSLRIPSLGIFLIFCYYYYFLFFPSPTKEYAGNVQLDYTGISGNTRAKNRVPPERKKKEAMLGHYYAGLRLYAQEGPQLDPVMHHVTGRVGLRANQRPC